MLIRIIEFSDPEAIVRHARISSLVDRMLDPALAARPVKGEYERTLLQRQIKATDRQINALVYELYGLTEEEIRIVEEACK